MTPKVRKLAVEISNLGEDEQQILLKHVAELNLCRGLYALSEQYREKLSKNTETLVVNLVMRQYQLI